MIQVAAAIIRRDNKILICQRGAGGNCAYLWEFPGGKREPQETLEQCLIRECKEELGVEIVVKSIFAETTYQYPDREIFFTFFNAELVWGKIILEVHQEYKWVEPNELADYEFCSADVAIVQRLI